MDEYERTNGKLKLNQISEKKSRGEQRVISWQK